MTENERKTWWCGTQLSTGVKVVAVVNLFYSLGLIIWEVELYFQERIEGFSVMNPEFSESKLDTMLALNVQHQQPTIPIIPKAPEELHKDAGDNKNVFSVSFLHLLISFLWILIWVISIFFSLFLYHAAVHRNRRRCSIWFYYRSVVLVLRIIFLIVFIIAGFHLLPNIPVVIFFVFGVYSLWLVNEFVKELRAEEGHGHEVYQEPTFHIKDEDGKSVKMDQLTP